MPKMRAFGYLCKGCGQWKKLGEVELSDDAGEQELRDTLLEQDWEGRIVKCLECSSDDSLTRYDLALLP